MGANMKFITEYDLRAKFNEQSFDKYILEKDSRLTPGARSFLNDRKVQIVESDKKNAEEVAVIKESESCEDKDTFEKDFLENLKKNEIHSKVELVEAYFLESASNLLDLDFKTAKLIIHLRNILKNIRLNTLENYENLDIGEIRDDFEISEFYLNSPNSKKIVLLNLLYIRVKNLRVDIAKLVDESEFHTINKALLVVMNDLSNLISGFWE